MKQGLIVIDVQNDYFPSGSMELVDMEIAARNCKYLIDWFRMHGSPVFFIQHIAAREDAKFFLPNTSGCEIHKSVEPLDSETIVRKKYPNSFRETELNSLLKMSEIEELVICGAMTHMCVDSTTRSAFDLGYSCILISDACATCDLEFNQRLVKAADVQTAFLAALSKTYASVKPASQFCS